MSRCVGRGRLVRGSRGTRGEETGDGEEDSELCGGLADGLLGSCKGGLGREEKVGRREAEVKMSRLTRGTPIEQQS